MYYLFIYSFILNRTCSICFLYKSFVYYNIIEIIDAFQEN